MKAIFSLVLLLASASTFATIGTMTTVLNSKEVKEFEAQMAQAHFNLSNVTDVHAQTAMFPRCMCHTLKLTFTSRDAAEFRTYKVSAKGLTELSVTIEEVAAH